MTTLRFLTYLIKPWDELNLLLSQRFAFQPEMSDVTRIAGSLAVAIKHQVEDAGLSRKVVDGESFDNRVMSDVADAWKHGSLDNPARNNRLTVGAQFECSSDNKFRFLRNVVTVHHATLGDLDLMVTAGEAISYWTRKLGLQVKWSTTIAEGPPEFHEEAFLYFNPKYQYGMSATNFRIVRRDVNGNLVPHDTVLSFAVIEMRAEERQ